MVDQRAPAVRWRAALGSLARSRVGRAVRVRRRGSVLALSPVPPHCDDSTGLRRPEDLFRNERRSTIHSQHGVPLLSGGTLTFAGGPLGTGVVVQPEVGETTGLTFE
jgi:hypothetical protein